VAVLPPSILEVATIQGRGYFLNRNLLIFAGVTFFPPSGPGPVPQTPRFNRRKADWKAGPVPLSTTKGAEDGLPECDPVAHSSCCHCAAEPIKRVNGGNDGLRATSFITTGKHCTSRRHYASTFPSSSFVPFPSLRYRIARVPTFRTFKHLASLTIPGRIVPRVPPALKIIYPCRLRGPSGLAAAHHCG
jgi:hypothetical protein